MKTAKLPNPKPFRRNYKACLSCRQRKTKCDLGPPENPQDPPCARCKRERKECKFPDSRRKGRNTSIPELIANESSVKTDFPDRSSRDSVIHGTASILLSSAYGGKQSKKISESDKPDHDKGLVIRPLLDFEYIGPGEVLSQQQAVTLVDFFFDYMHPYYPFLPLEIHDAYTLTAYPILLCAVLTISARYRPEPFYEKAHEKLWDRCQKLISMSVWGEASSRSLGTVMAFLLLTEWNPRAIHWSNPNSASNLGLKSSVAQSQSDKHEIDAMNRSSRMAWMLCGTSVRLAEDMGLMYSSPRVFVATHLSENTMAMNLSKRSILSESLDKVASLSMQAVSEEFREDPDVLKGKEEVIRKKSLLQLEFTRTQKATLQLLQIMVWAHIFVYKENEAALDSKSQIFAFLKHLSSRLNAWELNYKDYMTPISDSDHRSLKDSIAINKPLNPAERATLGSLLEKESLIMDLEYAKLYIYSNALTSEFGQVQGGITDNQLAMYVDSAFKAASHVLSCADRVKKLGILKYIPVRWVNRIFRAVAFVVRCYFRISADDFDSEQFNVNTPFEAFSITVERILELIDTAAANLRHAAPDGFHLCLSCSNLLNYLSNMIKDKEYPKPESVPPNLDANYQHLETSDIRSQPLNRNDQQRANLHRQDFDTSLRHQTPLAGQVPIDTEFYDLHHGNAGLKYTSYVEELMNLGGSGLEFTDDFIKTLGNGLNNTFEFPGMEPSVI